MLTPQQLTTLAAAIAAETDPAFVAARQAGVNTTMLEWFNAEAVPAVQAWRSSVPPEETDEVTPWPAFSDIAKAGQRDSWLHGFMRFSRDYTRGPVRKWVTDVWGNATVGSNSETILRGVGMRNITRAEAVLGGSNQASTNTVSALKLAWEGSLILDDIRAAVAL